MRSLRPVLVLAAAVAAGSAAAQSQAPGRSGPAPKAAQAPATAQKPAAPQVQAAAQPPAGAQLPGPFAGFGASNKGPINIEADRAEVLDKEKKAVFKGNVNIVQGEMNLKTGVLTVHYTGSALGGAQGGEAEAQTAGNQQIRRLEATGKVVVSSKDQVASGDWATYEAGDERIVMGGNVTLSQGTNVMQGERLIVDLRTGRANVEGSQVNRVRGVFSPNAAQGALTAPAVGTLPPSGAAPAAAATQKPAPASGGAANGGAAGKPAPKAGGTGSGAAAPNGGAATKTTAKPSG